MLGDVPVRTREQQAVVGMVRARAPQLLSVHDPLVTVALGARGQSRQIGTTARFAEQLAPCVFTRDGRAQEPRFHIVRTVREQRRCREPEADSERRVRSTHHRNFVRDDLVCPRRQSAPVPSRWPRRTRPTGTDQPAAPLDERECRIPLLGQPRAHIRADCFGRRRGGWINHDRNLTVALTKPTRRCHDPRRERRGPRPSNGPRSTAPAHDTHVSAARDR